MASPDFNTETKFLWHSMLGPSICHWSKNNKKHLWSNPEHKFRQKIMCLKTHKSDIYWLSQLNYLPNPAVDFAFFCVGVIFLNWNIPFPNTAHYLITLLVEIHPLLRLPSGCTMLFLLSTLLTSGIMMWVFTHTIFVFTLYFNYKVWTNNKPLFPVCIPGKELSILHRQVKPEWYLSFLRDFIGIIIVLHIHTIPTYIVCRLYDVITYIYTTQNVVLKVTSSRQYK